MYAEVLRAPAYRAYRSRLYTLLQIPIDASDQRIHELIEVGFLAVRLKAMADEGVISPFERDHIIPLEMLENRLSRGQALTVDESDRLFRSAHIAALTEALLGDSGKARRWLTKPKERFAGKTPVAMLSTIQGTRQVEEALVQLAEGFVF